MDSDLVLSLVLFGLFFFGLFFCYYSAQVRIKQEEYTLSACERSLLQYHHHHFNFGGQEINTVSRNAELQVQRSEMPPEYGKVGLPPPYELAVAGNPPPYNEAIQACNHSLRHQVLPNAAQELPAVHVIPRDAQITVTVITENSEIQRV